MLERFQQHSNTLRWKTDESYLYGIVQNKPGIVALGGIAAENFLDAFIVFPWHKAINRSGCRNSLLNHNNWQRKW